MHSGIYAQTNEYEVECNQYGEFLFNGQPILSLSSPKTVYGSCFPFDERVGRRTNGTGLNKTVQPA